MEEVRVLVAWAAARVAEERAGVTVAEARALARVVMAGHQNMVRTPETGTLVYTTRDGFSGGDGRTIGIALGPEGGAWGVDTSKAPKEVEDGGLVLAPTRIPELRARRVSIVCTT